MGKNSDRVQVADLLARLGQEWQLEARRSEPPAHSASRLAALEAEGGAILVAPPASDPPRRRRRLVPVLGVAVTIGALMLGVGFLTEVKDSGDGSAPVPLPEPERITADGVAQTGLVPPAPESPSQTPAPGAAGAVTAASPGGGTGGVATGRPASLSEVLGSLAGPAPVVGAPAAPAPSHPAAAAPAPAAAPGTGLAPVLAPITDVLNPLLLPLLTGTG